MPKLVVLFAAAALIAACGATPATTSPPPPRDGAPLARSAVTDSPPPPAPSAPKPEPRPDAQAIYAKLRVDLGACYERGRKATPEMLDGRLVLHAAIDASGKPLCVIPTDDTGLTQEVEDCMSDRLGKETFAPGTPWTATVPLVVRGGALALSDRAPDEIGLESVETHRMPNAFDVLETLVPQIEACVNGADRASRPRAMIVAARVRTDGKTQCALATPDSKVAECAAGVLRAAKFPPPKGGPGLVLVPIRVGS